MADSAPDSPSSPSARAYKTRSRVITAAEQFEATRPRPRVDAQQLVIQQDVEQLTAARRVSSRPESYDGGTASPTSSSRPVSLVSYGSPGPQPQAPAESPGSALASRMSTLSLGHDQAADGQRDGSSRKKGLFGAFSSPSSRSSPIAPSTNLTDAQVESAAPLSDGGLGLGLKGAGVAVEPQEGKENQRTPTAKPVRRSDSKDELALLVISSGITELSMSIQEVNTLLFEIQELRHISAPAMSPPSGHLASPSLRLDGSRASGPNSEASLSPSVGSDKGPAADGMNQGDNNAPSQADAALMRLESMLEVVGREFAEVEKQAHGFFGSALEEEDDEKFQASFLRRKWRTTVHEWAEAQKDAEVLGEELKEDKWITVFRAVSQQAEDMMRSLEKVLTQSSDFVLDITRRKARMDSSAHPTPRVPGSSSYFDETSNMQPLLNSFVALHRSLQAKVKYYSPACDRVLKILGKGIADRSTKNGEVLRKFADMKSRWRDLLERITRTELEMKGVEEMLKEVATTAPGMADPPKGQLTPSNSEGNLAREGGGMSPFRRLANKVTRSSPNASPTSAANNTRPEAHPTPSSSRLPRPSSASGFYPTAQTPPRPPKSANRRLVSGGVSPGSTPPRTPVPLNHRRSASAMNLEVPGSASTSLSSGMGIRPASRRAPSPAMSNNGAEKPRWNISTKRDDRDTIRSSRPPLSASASASQLALGQSAGRRSSSRLSMSGNLSRSYHGARPVSPAFSDASSSVIRDRPFTPSRIPAPSPASRQGNPFSSLDDPEPSSMLQRAMSPTPSTGSHRPLGASRRASSSRTHLPTPGGLSPPRASSPTPSNSSYRIRAMTPEPNLMAQAQRIGHVRMPSSSRTPRPPVPALPSSYRRESMIAAPRASLAPPPRRPSSAMSNRTEAGPSDGSYAPNLFDPLDVAVSQTIRALPLLLDVERADPPFSLAQVCQAELLQARYYFSLPGGRGLDAKPMMCKLVDRVGPRVAKGEKRVLVRVGAGWQGLDAYGMSLLATTV